MNNDISIKIGNVKLKSPLIIGANDSILNFNTFEKIAKNTKLLGAFVTKSITFQPRMGNKDPIIAQLENNILVSSGIRNPGFQQMLEEIKKYNKSYSSPLLIASIAINPDTKCSQPEKELAEMALELYNNGTNVVELNLSCPNLNSSQIVADKSGEVLKIISYIKNEFAKKNIKNNVLIAKLAGNDMALLNSSKQAQEAEIDAITILPVLYATGFYTGLIKQLQSLPIGEPLLGNVQGTIYGGGLGPITRQLVINLKKNISVPIIASGGCLGGMNSSILEKTDGFMQTMLTGAIATEIVTPFYPFTQEKILEIDYIINNYLYILSKNKEYNVKLQNLSSI